MQDIHKREEVSPSQFKRYVVALHCLCVVWGIINFKHAVNTAWFWIIAVFCIAIDLVVLAKLVYALFWLLVFNIVATMRRIWHETNPVRNQSSEREVIDVQSNDDY